MSNKEETQTPIEPTYFTLSDIKFLYRGFRDATFALFTSDTTEQAEKEVQNKSILLKLYEDKKRLAPLLECFTMSIIYIIGVCVLDFLLQPIIQKQVSQEPSIYPFSYLMTIIKLIGWHVPILVALSFGPTLWYKKINKIYEKVYNLKDQKVKISRSWIQIMIERALYKMLALAIVNSLASVIAFIPWIGIILAFLFNAWIYALYSFEGVLTYMFGSDIHKSLLYVERRWIYFLGFGIPSCIIAFYFSFFLGFGIWTIYYPISLILAVFARRPSIKEVEHVKPLPIFAPVRFIISLGHPANWFSKSSEKTEKTE